MTVQELVNLLVQKNQLARVMFVDDEHGLTDITEVRDSNGVVVIEG